MLGAGVQGSCPQPGEATQRSGAWNPCESGWLLCGMLSLPACLLPAQHGLSMFSDHFLLL